MTLPVRPPARFEPGELSDDLLVDAAAAGDHPVLLREYACLGLMLDGSPSDPCRKFLAHAADLGDPVARGLLDRLGWQEITPRRPGGQDLQQVASAWAARPHRSDTPEQIADQPAVFAVEGFLSDLERHYLMSSATPGLAPAIVDRDKVRPDIWKADAHRLHPTEGLVFLDALMARLAATVGHPDRKKSLTVVRYGPGGQFRPHFDSRPGDLRAVSAILYLSGDYEGGETRFPRVGLSFRGDPGDLLFFHNYQGDQPDAAALHAGAPVTSGEKWIATSFHGRAPGILTELGEDSRDQRSQDASA